MELEPSALHQSLKKLLWKLRGKLKSVDAIIFSNQSPSLTVMSESGTLLHPIITHLDRKISGGGENSPGSNGKGSLAAGYR